MKVELLCLCDFASVDAGGKLNLLGVFDSIQINETPASHGLAALAGKISFQAEEAGLKKFKIGFYDPERKLVMPPMEAEIEVNPLENESTANAQIVLLISQIRLPSFGKYLIELEIENKLFASTVLHVRKFPSR